MQAGLYKSLTALTAEENTDYEAKSHELCPSFVCPNCGSPMIVIEVLVHQYLPRALPLLDWQYLIR